MSFKSIQKKKWKLQVPVSYFIRDKKIRRDAKRESISKKEKYHRHTGIIFQSKLDRNSKKYDETAIGHWQFNPDHEMQ